MQSSFLLFFRRSYARMVAMNRIEITIHGDRGMNNLPRIEIGDESLFSKTGCHLEILPEMSSLECGCIYEISELRVVLTVSLSIDGEAGGDGRKDKGIAFFSFSLLFLWTWGCKAPAFYQWVSSDLSRILCWAHMRHNGQLLAIVHDEDSIIVVVVVVAAANNKKTY
mmetsp:Transcript_13123/g.27166  ORF Transcript_13123/g.27166 Transcript_13123/m.27166 type:complete len:167 (+) Transcript_13123:646-1146(+)